MSVLDPKGVEAVKARISHHHFTNRLSDALAAVSAYLEATAPSGQAPLEGVKALEWDPFRAFTPCGEYWVSEQPMANGRFGAFIEGRAVGLEYGSVAEAKAAAQTHFNAAIRSSLLPASAEPVAWIVGNGDGTKWRCWRDGMSDWTSDREQATRYARREDAEAVHRDDEDAWTVVPFPTRRAEPVATPFDPLKGRCPHCRYLDTNLGNVLDQKCELHQKIEDMQADIALERQISKDTNAMLREVCKVIGADDDDNPVEIAKDRMEELRFYDEEEALIVPPANAESVAKPLAELEAKALAQKAYFFEKQNKFPSIEDYMDENGVLSLPDDICPLLQGREANGRYSEADWWLSTIRALYASPPASGAVELPELNGTTEVTPAVGVSTQTGEAVPANFPTATEGR